METALALLFAIGTPILLVVGLMKPSLFGGVRKHAVLVAVAFALATSGSFAAAHEPPERTASLVTSTITGASALPAPSSAATPAARSTARTIPDDQAQFLSVIETYRRRFDDASNDMVRGALRPERAGDLCAALPDPAVRGWSGRIEGLSSTNDGQGVLQVRLSEQASIQTTNNTVSEAGYGMRTLIPPGSPLHKTIAAMRKGQEVVVDGAFLSDHNDCVREVSLTVWGAMRDPSFLFHFINVVAVE